MKDFFISYNRADRTWAEWIAWQLEAEGYEVIMQAWDFRPSENFVLEMHHAIEEAERTIAVLSPDYLTSEFAAPEWAAAFVQDPTSKESKLLPVRVRECEPGGLLRAIVYIDLLKLDEATAKQTLLDGVQQDRAKPKLKPAFPNAPVLAIMNKPRFPGAMPAIWNIPFLRNQNFTGRENELAELHASLNADGTMALVQARAISGLGGVGKTQLAIEYAYRYAGDYDVVWWIRSEDTVTLLNDYASLAAKLDLPEKVATEQRVVVEAVKERLRISHGWLLIFDNAEGAKSIDNCLPRGGRGHIIITSRNPSWKNVAKSLSVKSLPLDKATEFLLKRTGSKDETTAKELAEKLGCLPLALEQASAFIETSGRTPAHYLELFENRQNELMKRGALSTEYPDTVATTWSISFQKVEQDNQSAAELLRLCAYFAPDDIPLKLITEGIDELLEPLAATVKDPFLFDEVLIALRKYSLIEVEDEKLSIHRLVQGVIRQAMDGEDFKQWAGVAVHVVSTSFPESSNDVRMWPLCALLLPHATVALSHAEAIKFASDKTALLLNQIGLYLDARAEYAQARLMYEPAIAIGEATLGPDHHWIAIFVNNLGEVLRAQGDLEGAKALYKRALAIDEVAIGPNELQVATFANNLGLVLREQGDLEGAKALFERAIAIDKAALGPDHPDIAIDLNNLGSVLNAQGDLEGAKALFERAITIAEEALGPNHPDVSRGLNSLGEVLRAQGDLEGAKALCERALAIDEAAFGPDHPSVANRLNDLGLVLKAQGDLAGAKALFERSLHIFKKFLGNNHPNTKMVQDNLRLLEEEMKNAI